MINREISNLIDEQFKRFREMLLRKETFMLRKDYRHNEVFIQGSFKNLRQALDLLHKTIEAIYAQKTKK